LAGESGARIGGKPVKLEVVEVAVSWPVTGVTNQRDVRAERYSAARASMLIFVLNT
jgi:hypothetical protein